MSCGMANGLEAIMRQVSRKLFCFRFFMPQAGKGASGNSRIAAHKRQFSRKLCFFSFLRCKPGRGRAAILELPFVSGNSGGNSRENYVFWLRAFQARKGSSGNSRIAARERQFCERQFSQKNCRPAILFSLRLEGRIAAQEF